MSNEDLLASLTPAEIQQLLGGYNDSGYEDYGDVFDFSYGGAPSESQMIQPGVDYFTTKGAVNLGDLGQEAKRVNLLQDMGSLSVDNILTGYAGGGAYDVGAFTPTYEYGDPVNLPGRRKAQSLAGAGGWQGVVSDLILNEGMSPAEAEAALYKFIETPADDPGLTEKERTKKQAVIDSMKPLMAADTKAPTSLRGNTGQSAATTAPYDSESIRQFTTNIWSDLMEDPEFKYQDPDSGLFYDKTPEEAMVKTPQMAAYDKFGIPYPTATYDDPKYMEQFAALSAGGAGAEEREAQYGGWQQQQDARDKAFQDARKGEVQSLDAAGALEKAFAETQAKQRPMTEWDAILDAQRSGGDQQAARDQFNRQYGPNQGGQGPLAPQPKPATFDELLNAGEQPGGGFDFLGGQAQAAAPAASQFDFFNAKPPMISDPGPLSGVNSRGDRVLRDDPSLRRRDPWDFGAMLTGKQRPIPTVSRTKQEDVTKQRERAKAQTSKRSQAANASFQATYQDPRLAEVDALARAYVLRQAGQTPFRDAMQARNANARTMLSGA